MVTGRVIERTTTPRQAANTARRQATAARPRPGTGQESVSSVFKTQGEILDGLAVFIDEADAEIA
jgi:hypothetical protein